MKSYYTTIEGRQVHFLKLGSGAPIVLLHASPQSSSMMIPFMKILSQQYTVIAPDTPGYGGSERLRGKKKKVADYCQFLNKLFRKLGLSNPAIYGTATGAQLAIRYALLYPKEVSHIYLDNAAHFTEDQRRKILKSYFPDISPRYDGSHIITVWTMVRDLFMFFPWCDADRKNRLKIDFPPAGFLHKIALQYFKAGDGYADAYRAAFNHERARYLQRVKIPGTLFYWQGSILKKYTKQLADHDLPDNIVVHKIPKDPTKRYDRMSRHIFKTYLGNTEYILRKKMKEVPIRPQADIPEFIHELPILKQDENGAYLVDAWFFLRDRQLYNNPADKSVSSIKNAQTNLDPNYLQQLLLQWMERT